VLLVAAPDPPAAPYRAGTATDRAVLGDGEPPELDHGVGVVHHEITMTVAVPSRNRE
jgi:hypothetical protein